GATRRVRWLIAELHRQARARRARPVVLRGAPAVAQPRRSRRRSVRDPAAHHAAPYRRIDLTRRVAALVSLLFVVRVFERHVARRSTGATAAARPMAPGSRHQLAIDADWC